MSLRDVLVERGNFWQDKSKKVENIWDRDPNMPEEEIMIHDGMLVGDVLFDTTPTPEPEKQEIKQSIPETREPSTLLGISEDGTDAITIEQASLRRHTLIVGQT